MFSVSQYARLNADEVRTGAYHAALQRAVRPGAVVLDVGTGAGMFALLACRAGARRVYAVEGEDIVHLGRQLAAANGLADRMEFIQGMSTQLKLPEPVDIIVSDIRGALPLHLTSLPSLIDARERWLAPGGIMIPQRDSLWVALASTPELYQARVASGGNGRYGLDLQLVHQMAGSDWFSAEIAHDQLVVEPRSWATIDYAHMDSPNVAGEAHWTMDRAATVHGFAGWFEASLFDDIGFSTAPAGPLTVYKQAFFPWPQPVDLAAGDRVSLVLQADSVGGDYVWRWDSTVRAPGAQESVKASFRQCSLGGLPIPSDRLRRHSADFMPSLNEEGEMECFTVAHIDGKTTLGQISRELAQRYPSRFPRWEDALTWVARFTDRLGR